MGSFNELMNLYSIKNTNIAAGEQGSIVPGFAATDGASKSVTQTMKKPDLHKTPKTEENQDHKSCDSSFFQDELETDNANKSSHRMPIELENIMRNRKTMEEPKDKSLKSLRQELDSITTKAHASTIDSNANKFLI